MPKKPYQTTMNQRINMNKRNTRHGKKNTMTRYFIGLCCLVLPICATASVQTELNHLFTRMGGTSNVTGSGTYNTQRASYYTGGSVFSSVPVKSTQLASLQLPHIRAGCGGIDVFTGGFSHINAEQFKQSLQNIMNNATGYAFTLGLEAVTPQIANVMKYVQTIADKVNQSNIQSCEAAASLVGSIWPKTQLAEQQQCATAGAQNGSFADYAQAKAQCGVGNHAHTVLQKSKLPRITKGNLTWQALQHQPMFQGDTALSEWMMSFAGTLIVNVSEENPKPSIKALPSLAGNPGLLNALLFGGKANVFQCDDTKQCLNPTLKAVVIKKSDAIQTRVQTLLERMVAKVLTDTPLTDAEVNFLNSTHLPVYKMLNVQVAFSHQNAMLDLIHYSDIIALDWLSHYLDQQLALIRRSGTVLSYPEAQLNLFYQGLAQAQQALLKQQKSVWRQLNMAHQLVDRTHLLEQMLAQHLN